MAADDLPQNLRLLCAYSKSISDACRRIGINRQQFTKYLNGQSRPSLNNLRRICDHFGLEEWEILLDHTRFKELIALRPPPDVQSGTDPLFTFIEGFVRRQPLISAELRRYSGYYFSYFRPKTWPGRVQRALIHVHERDGAMLTKNVERYSAAWQPYPAVIKYNGIMLSSADRLFVFEREAFVGRALWHTVLYASDFGSISYLSGLTVGITNEPARDVACYRVVFEFLGERINRRHALAACDLFDDHSDQIPAYVKPRIANDITADEYALSPR